MNAFRFGVSFLAAVLAASACSAQNRRMINGNVVDLTPLINYSGPIDSRPLKAWRKLEGTRTSDGPGGTWVVLARIDNSQPQRFVLRNPPTALFATYAQTKQKHDALSRRLAELDAADRKAQAAGTAADRTRIQLGRSERYDSETLEARRQAVQDSYYAKLDQSANDSERTLILNQMAKLQIPGQDLTKEFTFSVWAMEAAKRGDGTRVFDCGSPVR